MSKRKAVGGGGSDSDEATKGQDPQAVSRSGRMRKKSSRLIELEEESINEEALNYELNHARSFSSSKKAKPTTISSQKIVAKSVTPQTKGNTCKSPAAIKTPGAEIATPAKKQVAAPLAASTPLSTALTGTQQIKKKPDVLSKADSTPVTPLTTRVAASSMSVGPKDWLPPDRETLNIGGAQSGGRGKRQSPAASVPTMNLSSTRYLPAASRSTLLSSSNPEDDFDNDDDADDDDIVNQLIGDGELDIDDDLTHSEDEESDSNDDEDDEMDDYETEDGGGSKDGSSTGRAGPSGAAASKFFEKQKPKGIVGQKKAKRRRNRAPTAYTLWCSSYRQKIVAQNPGIDFASMSKRLGEIWHALPQKEKVQWKKKAKKLAAQGLSSAPPEPAVRQRPVVNLLATGSRSAAATNTHRSSPSSTGGTSKTTVTVTAVQQKKMPVTSTKDASNDQAAASRPSAAVDAAPLEQAKQEPYKVVTSEPLDVAAHLKLLGESLSLIGIRLTNQANIAVQGSLTVLLDSMLCAAGALTCLTQQVPELDGLEPEVHLSTLDNIAYFMPGI